MTVSRLDPVRRARRTMAAGGALWREGLVYEAHAHMATALREALAAWVPVVGESGGTAPAAMEERAVRELAIAGYRDVDRVRDALAATVSVTGSASSDSIAASALSDFEWIWGEAERLCRFGSRRLATPVERQRARMRLTVVGALGLIVFGVLFVRIWARPHVSASGVFSREFPASYAVDGIDSTSGPSPIAHRVGY